MTDRSEGERKQVTVLFADVAGFTSISEELDPEDVSDLIRPCIDLMVDEVHRFAGTVTQFMGDGIMALFGAPTALEDAPRLAVCAALAIQDRVSPYTGELKNRGIELELRIGLNTGLAVVGSVGEDAVMEFTAIGDTVNLASRMESTAQPGTVQVSESTHRLTENYFDFEPLGPVEVKGKKGPTQAWRVLTPKEARTRMEAAIPAGLSPLVGRTQELSYLADRFKMAAQGQGQVIGIVGEPGVGKSRLVLEFRQSLPPDGLTYLEGSCLHYGESMPYLPLLEVLRGFFDIKETDEEQATRGRLAEKLAGLHPELQSGLSPLQELLSLEVEDESYLSLEPQARRQLTFETIRNLLVRLSLERPLVIAMEDLQWMDSTTGEFLGFLIDSIPGSHILLILLYRPEYTSPWTSRSYWTQLSLRQLSQDTSSSLISAILPGARVSAEVSDLIIARTAGNPLFIEELARGLLESGTIKRNNGSYVLAGSASALEIPETVQGIISSRLDGLGEACKRTMQVASVIGREFAYRLLAVVTPWQEELKELLSELQSLEFIYEKSLFPELEYVFKHALTQEVAYESLLRKRRREIHGAIGRAMEALYPERLEEFYGVLAYHYERSEESEKAIHFLRLAGKKAARAYACEEAVAFYMRAVGILDAGPETGETKRRKFDLYYTAFNAIMMLSYPEWSREMFDEAERLASELGDPDSLSRFYGAVALYYSFKGDTSLALEYSEKCFEQAEEAGDVEAMATSAGSISNAVYFAGGFSKIVDICGRTIDALEEHGRKDLWAGGITLYAAVGMWLGSSLAAMGRIDEGRVVLLKSLESSHREDDTWGVGWTELGMANLDYWEGSGEDMIEHAGIGRQRFEEIGMRSFLPYPTGQMALGHFMLGDNEAAICLAEEALRLDGESGLPHLTPSYHMTLAEAHRVMGDLDTAVAEAEEALRLSGAYGTPAWEGWAYQVLGRALAEFPERGDEALRCIRQGIDMNLDMEYLANVAMGYLYLGEAYGLAGEGAKAREGLREAESRWVGMGLAPDSYWLARTRKSLAALA